MQYSQSPDEEQYSSSLQNKPKKLTSHASFNDEELERRYYGSREHEGTSQSSYEIEEQKYIGKGKGKGIRSESLDEDQCCSRDRKRQKLLRIVYRGTTTVLNLVTNGMSVNILLKVHTKVNNENI
jgi:hypothetical protein